MNPLLGPFKPKGLVLSRKRQGPGFSGGVNVVAPPNPLLTSLVSQYKMNEASGSFVDSVGGFNLIVVNSPGVGTHLPLASRSFNGTNYGSAAMNAAQDCSGKDFSFDCLFWPIINASNYGVFHSRNAGSADGNLEFILRVEGSNLTLLIGNGLGAFTDHVLVTGFTTASKYHVVAAFTNSSKNVDYWVNGVAQTSYTNGSKPTTAPVNNKIALGGDVSELAAPGCEISVSRLWINRVLAGADAASLWNGGNGIIL